MGKLLQKSWCYMAQMNVNDRITWWYQYVQHGIQVEEV